VFKLDSAGNYTVLHNYCAQANCADGDFPETSLIIDTSGNLYGTTTSGGANGGGTVFKLDSDSNYTVLYSFCSKTYCADGSTPLTSLIKDVSGNLYGTTSGGGGGYGEGTVFKLDGGGNYSVLHSFCTQGNCTDGGSPRSLIEDDAGNFFGETSGGGTLPGAGTVFELNSAGNFSTLYYFCSQANCTDGYVPIIAPPIPVSGNLIEDSSGNLYGTTSSGGSSLMVAGEANSNVYGVIFKLALVAPPTPNFTLTLNPTTMTFSSPGSEQYTTLTITPTGGFNQAIAFSGASCSGLPLGASCAFSQSTVTPNGGAVPITLSVTTTGASSAMQHLQPWKTQSFFLAVLTPFLFLRWPKSRVNTLRKWALVTLALIPLIGLNACGGGTSGGANSGGGGTTGGQGTPAGTYIVTVTGKASSFYNTATLTLVVQ
jgi:uncharacterized repeat protein (TIGR03803 family)